VLDVRKQLTLSDAIAPQLVGHNHSWLVLQTLQQPFEEALRRLGIAPGLNQDIEHNAILIDGAPEIVLHALDPDEDFVHVPLVARSRPASPQAVGETRGEFLAPASHRLVGDDDATLGEDQLNIPQAQAEHVVQPDRVADNLRWKAVAVVWVRWQLHAANLASVFECRQTRVTVTMLKQALIDRLKEEGSFDAFPDAVRLASALDAAGPRLALASSPKNARAMLSQQTLPDGRPLLSVFDADLSGTDVAHGKPDPALFLLAAKALNTPPAECLVVEDAPAGVRAARAGGMAGLGIARLGDEALLQAADANLVVTNLDQVDTAAIADGVLRIKRGTEAPADA
jgi:HAD superfamily hydrolase (TIGR01509 family)